jgi:hypothetical protein
MNPTSVLACLAVSYCLSSRSQTNACSPGCPLFYFPPIQLRLELRPEPDSTGQKLLLSPPPLAEPPQVSISALDSTLVDSDLHSRVVRSGEFYLRRPETKSEDVLVRLVDGIFRPEIVHIGKIPLSCSLVTAIKRKNPLCLLNPIFFQASW